MRGSSAAPLPILRQIFLCVVDSHRAVRYGGDHLPQGLGAHVAPREHAGEGPGPLSWRKTRRWREGVRAWRTTAPRPADEGVALL